MIGYAFTVFTLYVWSVFFDFLRLFSVWISVGNLVWYYRYYIWGFVWLANVMIYTHWTFLRSKTLLLVFTHEGHGVRIHFCMLSWVCPLPRSSFRELPCLYHPVYKCSYHYQSVSPGRGMRANSYVAVKIRSPSFCFVDKACSCCFCAYVKSI